MLPLEVWEDGKRKKRLPLRHGASDHDYILYRAAYEITNCLEKWLKVPLDYNQTFLPALLMLNLYEGPVWMHADQGQEIGDIRKVVKETRRAKQSIKSAIDLEKKGDNGASKLELDRAIIRMKGLPPPVSLWIENAACDTLERWLRLLSHIHVLFTEYAKERKGRSGHIRARTAAIVVRAVFEVHSEKPISLGITEQVPEGDYGKCVQEVFSWAGIPVNFYRYARIAKNLPQDDEQLAEIVGVLREQYCPEPPTPVGPIFYDAR